ncbi:GroES-like protein [Amniculicola lignicola CBS 123094]|uniref:GroES-like protein n=1 Tax=Amniculicola lignicola CBS 123094 TaxID=1392246 RepID=A0A6A5VXQ0_9PLEO|nr:GroES-like protein [Amniculicola lignicola CBS 123094]
MATHKAIATMGIKQPLDIITVSTISPERDEVRVRVEWTASTPLDLHQNDGGLLVKHPQVLGDGTAGTVVEIGPEVKILKIGDKVFGFTWRKQEEKAHQDYCTAPEWLFAVLPERYTLQQAVTLPNNFVTVFHAISTDWGVDLPWPKLEGYVPEEKDKAVLIWGGATSVGQYAIQILKYYGYTNIVTTASKGHHEALKKFGARWTLEYRSSNIVQDILDTTGTDIRYVLDCVGSLEGSMKPVSKVAGKGCTVAILLPVVVRDSSEDNDPLYGMDTQGCCDWEQGVEVKGVRTHFYLEPDIMHTMLKEGIVEPNKQKVIEGKTMLERAQKAMDALRRKEASGERLVWRVSDNLEDK